MPPAVYVPRMPVQPVDAIRRKASAMNTVRAVHFGILALLMATTAYAQKPGVGPAATTAPSSVSLSQSAHASSQRRSSLSAACRSGYGRVFRHRTA